MSSNPVNQPVVRGVLAMGLQASGKTTFVGALRHVISAADGPTALTALKIKGDHAYLNAMEQCWLRCEDVPHTRFGTIEPTQFELATALGERLDLWLPDLSGEDFGSVFLTRTWTPALAQTIPNADSVLLFLNPEETHRTERLQDLLDLEEAIGDAPDEARLAVADEASPAPIAFEDADRHTAAVLVDLLQAMSDATPQGRILKVAIVVSAWDTMASTGLTPEDWVRLDVALLDQFLRSNAGRFHFRVFGVSALGGDISNPEVKKRLLQITKPWERIKVIESSRAESHDLTRPLEWLLTEAR